MPYTPPSQLSPAASASATPVPSRSSSYLKSSEPPTPAERPHLPRSTGSSSYLNKQRRSPTATQDELSNPMTDSERGIVIDPHGSMRQSPPPRTNGLIPSGMTISPPDSSHNSDDEEVRGRSRELGHDLGAELHAAISQIHVRKSGSPTRDDGSRRGAADTHGSLTIDTRPPLSREARKISHSRSNTDSNIIFEAPSQLRINAPVSPRLSSGEEEEDDESYSPNDRPPMVRKKSGELVRPALRPASRRRPSSMPGTPTYSKAVHFDSHLEHVRHFLQVDRPLAVSAGSSPVEAYESETEFPFGSDEQSTRSRSSYEWEIRLANFPAETNERRVQPVQVERVFLSSDNKNLIGTVAVQNLAFQKLVVARFTLDYWKTTSEVVADYSNDLRRTQQQNDGLDRFNFSIRLADQANLENKTLFFCVRYNVNGQEYWDSNDMTNYQVDFTKKVRVQSARNQPTGLGARPISALPRSRPSPPVSSGRSPVRSANPPSFDDFGYNFDNFGMPFGQSPSAAIGEPKIKLRSPRSKGELVPDAPMRRNKSSGPMFGHRYDFNSSLTAAKNNAFAALGEQSGLSSRPDAKQSPRQVPAVAASKSVYDAPQKQVNGVVGASAASVATAPGASKPTAAPASEKPSLTSQSYQELVEKYCFFGTGKNSTPLTKTALGMVDGADDLSSSDMSTASGRSSGSSTPTGKHAHSFSPPSDLSSWKSISAHNTRSSSPLPRTGSCLSSRSSSPGMGYLYTSPLQAILAETPTSTPIHG